jgi:hypothetical protein
MQVAEEVATRNISERQKACILLAIARALSAPQIWNIESIDDVTRLMLTDPDEFERLLRAYWLLLGVRRPVA